MVTLFRRSALFQKHLRHVRRSHSDADAGFVPTSNINVEKEAFEAVLPEVVNAIVTSPTLTSVPKMSSWVKQMLSYTLTTDNFGSGLTVSIGYRMFEDPKLYSEETQHSARVLGWCVEMLQGFIQILDDIVDGSTVRHGTPSWYLQPHVGLSAVNDSILMQQSMMEILETNFGKTPFYIELIRLFNETVYKTMVGQHLDCMLTYNTQKDNIDVLNLDNYNTIATQKASYCAYRLPILLALLLIKNGKQKATKELNDICLDLGILLQGQDDYIDAYGDETIISKVSRDIQEGKCSWVAATALQRCNEEQRSIFKEYYGSEDPEHMKQIKRLYNELNIPEVYKHFERTMYDDLVRRIHALPTKEQTTFLIEVLNGCYRTNLPQGSMGVSYNKLKIY